MDFRGHVAAAGSFEGIETEDLTILEVATCETKVGKFDLCVFLVFGDQDVVQLQVSMNDIVTVQMVHSLGELFEESADLGSVQRVLANEVQ